MGSKTRLGSYCTKRANNGVNLVTSRKINTRLARPISRASIQSPSNRKAVRTLHGCLACHVLTATLSYRYREA